MRVMVASPQPARPPASQPVSPSSLVVLPSLSGWLAVRLSLSLSVCASASAPLPLPLSLPFSLPAPLLAWCGGHGHCIFLLPPLPLPSSSPTRWSRLFDHGSGPRCWKWKSILPMEMRHGWRIDQTAGVCQSRRATSMSQPGAVIGARGPRRPVRSWPPSRSGVRNTGLAGRNGKGAARVRETIPRLAVGFCCPLSSLPELVLLTSCSCFVRPPRFAPFSSALLF